MDTNHIIYTIYIILLIIGLFFVWKIGYSFFSNAWRYRKLPPYVNSFGYHLRLLDKYNWKSGSTITDLGCGDGKTLRYICNRFGMQRWVWYDLNTFAIWYGKFVNKLYRLFGIRNDITLINNDIYSADIRWSDYIYIYLFPDFMADMEDRLWSSCDKWTIIIANTFAFSNHTPYTMIKNDKWKIIFRFYKV